MPNFGIYAFSELQQAIAQVQTIKPRATGLPHRPIVPEAQRAKLLVTLKPSSSASALALTGQESCRSAFWYD